MVITQLTRVIQGLALGHSIPCHLSLDSITRLWYEECLPFAGCSKFSCQPNNQYIFIQVTKLVALPISQMIASVMLESQFSSLIVY